MKTLTVNNINYFILITGTLLIIGYTNIDPSRVLVPFTKGLLQFDKCFNKT